MFEDKLEFAGVVLVYVGMFGLDSYFHKMSGLSRVTYYSIVLFVGLVFLIFANLSIGDVLSY